MNRSPLTITLHQRPFYILEAVVVRGRGNGEKCMKKHFRKRETAFAFVFINLLLKQKVKYKNHTQLA